MACVQTSPSHQKKSGTGEGDICTQATGSKRKGEPHHQNQILVESMNMNWNFSEGLEGRVHSVWDEYELYFLKKIILPWAA